MLEFDAATGTLTVSIWAAGAASAVFLAAIMLMIGRAGVVTGIDALFRVGILAIAVSAVWLYTHHTERQERAAERRLLDERAAALLARATAPGSSLSCLDELAGETAEVACEKAVFGSPESVAAAAIYVAAQLALLADGDDYARRVDRTFAAELAPLRASLELDRFGMVAHVLAERHGCTVDKCDALTRFGDQSRVVANLRDGTFDEQMAKFASTWTGPLHAASDGAAAAPSSAALPNLGSAPATVSPRYDFPSSQSIPPVNIMVPESSAPRASAVPAGQPTAAPGDGNSRAATTPVPPRRPPQGRTPTAVRPPAPRPTMPVAVGETPTNDGAAPHASAPAQTQ